MMRNLAYLALLFCAPLHAQTVSGAVSPDLATKANLEQLRLQMAATAAAAAVPPPCDTPPLPDTLVGSAGSAPVCVPRPDNTRATVIQAKITTTLSDASWSVVFDQPFATVPIYVDARVYGMTAPYLCTVQAVTATGANGKCYQLVATTLPGVLTALNGLVVSPIASAAAGLSIRVVARQ